MPSGLRGRSFYPSRVYARGDTRDGNGPGADTVRLHLGAPENANLGRGAARLERATVRNSKIHLLRADEPNEILSNVAFYVREREKEGGEREEREMRYDVGERILGGNAREANCRRIRMNTRDSFGDAMIYRADINHSRVARAARDRLSLRFQRRLK